jgi:hypothetical protein
MIEQLSRQIWGHDQFHREVGELRETLLRHRFVAPIASDSISEDAIVRLLKSALTLAASASLEHRQTSYQIATAAAEMSEHFPGARYALLLVLSRLGNFPALAYARRRFEVSEASLPIRSYAETSDRAEANTIHLAERDVAVTDFQFELWKRLTSGENVGVSAPTSAGKSFILQTYAHKVLLEGRAKNVAFLVPTRALINQVSDDVSVWLSASGLNAELVTTPIPRESDLPPSAAYIVTQERMQLLQTAHPTLTFELMVVDEAQSIGDGPRGVLLSSVIEEALERNSGMQLLLAGPNLSNPSRLAKPFGSSPSPVRTDEASVTQNIIFVDCDEVRPRYAKLSLLAEGNRIPFGQVDCEQPLTDHRSKLINVALRLGAGGQNLIYALGPAECEQVAFGLADRDTESSSYLQELSTFIKEAVHEKYPLAQNVIRQVGYHYGRQPSLVRKAIEDAFGEGHLQHLVTTSTLLYGVNLPAQNLFLHNPERGQNQPISSNDFWNLAGRAGRMGKEFSGNIFLIDYAGWESDPITGPKDAEITPSIEDHVVFRVEELTSYINDPERIPDRDKPDELENTFVKLVRDHLDGRLERTLSKLGLDSSSSAAQLLIQAVQKSVANTDIDRYTLLASPTVSVHRQQSLYDRLEASLDKKGPSYIIPKHPRDSGAYQSYVGAIRRCHAEILKYPKADKSDRYYAQIALRWMKGDPLPRIIDASYNYKVDQGQSPNYPTVIRNALTEIESDLRFKYVRLFSCYNAVLELLLKNKGMDELVASIPAVPMYLEVGACSPTMISFLGLGLSRFTAGKLSVLPRQQDMTQVAAKAWIKRQEIDTLELPQASVREIRRLIF